MDSKLDGGLIRCSFCGRPSTEVTSMVAGPDVYICDRCVASSVDIIKNDLAAYSVKRRPNGSGGGAGHRKTPHAPAEIKAALDEYVVGQDRAKRALSVAVYNHYKRIDSNDALHTFDDVEIEKSNILLIGPTGTGKTLLAQTLARVLDVPFSIADATALTEAGYVGEDVESILAHLLQAADYNIERTERGIIYIDEIDKIARKSDNASITRDVSGEGVQQALLKLLEGTVAGVPPKGGRKHPEQSLVNINTKNILFIVGGAFEGLEKIISKRVLSGGMGFGSDIKRKTDEGARDIFRHVEPDDLLKFGLIPELIGRLPVLTTLEPLDEAALRDILLRPRNALVKQYQKLFRMEGVELSFEEAAIDRIVAKAMARGTGARALRSIIEALMLDIMYALPGRRDVTRCVITDRVVDSQAEPLYVHEDGKKSA